MKFRRIIWLALLCLTLSGCYSIRQGLHQNELFNRRKPIHDILHDPATSDKLRGTLIDVAKILDFAQIHGLNADGAYTYYIDTSDSVVSYLVQAAYPDRFEFKTWWFPVVGEVPYLGFFSKRERDQLAETLASDGFDIHKAGVGAFSSLGWFDDPLFSSMLRRSDADLAHLLFHELTHRTVWIPGSVEFNENLAEYVGGYLTEQYLLATGNKELVDGYFARKGDKRKFRIWLKNLKKELAAFYKEAKGKELASILAGKQAILAKYMKEPLRPTFTKIDYIGDETWNNASIMGASLYTPDIEMFEQAHACIGQGHLLQFLLKLKNAAEQLGDGFAGLESLCNQPNKSGQN